MESVVRMDTKKKSGMLVQQETIREGGPANSSPRIGIINTVNGRGVELHGVNL